MIKKDKKRKIWNIERFNNNSLILFKNKKVLFFEQINKKPDFDYNY